MSLFKKKNANVDVNDGIKELLLANDFSLFTSIFLFAALYKQDHVDNILLTWADGAKDRLSNIPEDKIFNFAARIHTAVEGFQKMGKENLNKYDVDGSC